jgi:Tol biopolymer transport system component
MNPDGSGVTRLSQDAFNDQASARSKDGKSLLISSDEPGQSALYVMHADGSPRTALTRTSSLVGGAKWSPDGNTIVFDEDVTGNGCYRVFKMNAADGTRVIEDIVVDGSGTTALTPPSGDCAWSASWSPDGTKIAFGTTRDGNFDIYLMNADGSNPTRLTGDYGRNDAFPVFAPDGKRILFTSWNEGLDPASADVYMMNADGTERTRLTTNPTEDSYPAWSPDGARIVFQSGRDGNLEIYLMNADGSGQTRVTSDPAEDFGAIWPG